MDENQIEFKLEKDFIELDNLLKAMDFAASGAEAKKIIQAGLVKVNGVAENRVRRKLRRNDNIDVKEKSVRLI